jgi:hypothetical protein
MAKNQSFDASLATLRRLFTAAERKILDSSTTRSLAAASEAELKNVLRQARILRDKWRDLLDAQARKTKRVRRPAAAKAVAGAAPANVRSRQKNDLLTAAVTRLEGRLADFAPAKAVEKAAPAAKAPVKRAKLAKKKPSKAAPSAIPAFAVTPRAISKKARQAGSRKALEMVGVQGLKTSAATQRSAAAALTAERLKIKGITTRRAGHAQARVGRAQARRDQRNASR